MALLIGTDEAGYGPNLGPLVISATAWRVPDSLREQELYDVLAGAVTARPDRTSRLVICDSKQLYKSGGGLQGLEESLLAALVALGKKPRTWRALWRELAVDQLDQVDRLPWYAQHDEQFPTAADVRVCDQKGVQLREVAAARGVELLEVRSAVLTAPVFNKRLAQCGNKSTLLSETTLQLVADLLYHHLDREVIIQCDKHGGRRFYGAVLQHTFPTAWIEAIRESQQESRYRWTIDGRRVEIRFQAKGESFLPAALASIAAKSLREIAMRALNGYWRSQQQSLRPTAGYPVDAKRFFHDIEPLRLKLHVQDDLLWRRK